MQLVLVAGFKTGAGKAGPKVRLFEGDYRIVTEHLIDSELGIRHSSGLTPVCNDTHVRVSGEISDKDFHLEVIKAGTEPFINVFAEYINGSNSPKST